MYDMRGLDRRDYWFGFLCILIMFLLAVSRTVISIGLNQPGFMAQYAGVMFGVISILCVLLFIIQAVNRKRISITEAGAVCLIIYILLNIYITSIVHGGMSKVAYDSLLEYGVKGIPAILLGCVAARKKALHTIVDIIDYLMVFLSLAMTRALLLCITQTVNRLLIGEMFGADYQQISYYAGYFFALNMFMIFVGRRHVSGKVRTSFLFQTVRIAESVVFAAVSLYSGGRGGFVLILFTLLFWVFYYSIKAKKYKYLIVGFVLLPIFLYVFFYNVLGETVFSTGYFRVFEFIGKNSIDWAGTSGRRDIYLRVFELIEKNPIFGYGITGGSYIQADSAHNWLLEILLEGGIIYFSLWIIILYRFIKKMRYMVKADECYWLIATVFLTDFVGLMFSFIYLRCTALWFAVFYVLNDHPATGVAKIEERIEQPQSANCL